MRRHINNYIVLYKVLTLVFPEAVIEFELDLHSIFAVKQVALAKCGIDLTIRLEVGVCVLCKRLSIQVFVTDDKV